MSATSPSPNSSVPAVPPASTTTPPPQPQSTPPSSDSSPPLQPPPPSASPVPPSSSPGRQPGANPPATSTPSNPSPPPQSPPPAVPSNPPPFTQSPPPPSLLPSSPPLATVPQPSSAPPPPSTKQTPPPSGPPPPPSLKSPPPSPPQTPPPGSPPPPTTPANPPLPSSPNPPPPPTSSLPPQHSPPPPIDSPAPTPPVNSPPPPSPPVNSNPPPSPPQSPAFPPTSPPKHTPPTPIAVPPRSPRSPPASIPQRPPVRSAPPPPLTTSGPPDPFPPNSSSGVFPPRSPSASSPPTTNGSETSNSNGGGGIGTGGTVAIAVVVGVVFLSLLGSFIWCMRKKRKRASGNGYIVPSTLVSSPGSDSSFLKGHSSAPLIPSASGSDFVSSPSEPGGLGNSRFWFAYEELIKATNGFSEQNLLGEGGFGSVHRGCLPDGREIAVKQLKIGGGQGEREFKAEVEIISRIHHRHLVSLVGYCILDNRRLLVYDYLPNNNLYFHLHEEGRPFLDWAKRVKVAVGAARGIAYLHEDCQPRIIHRDIKSSNILLDHNFEARVSDFGLAKLALDADTHITTRVIGTFGYVAPEYASSGKLTEKSDVYSFGVVLLELITGRKPVDTSQPIGDESLVEWARPLLSHALDSEEFEGLTDPRLGKNYVDGEMLRMIEVAAVCIRHSAAKRPSMGQVVRAFESLAASDLSNGMRVGESEVFDSAQQSAEIRWFRRMAFGSQSYSSEFLSQNFEQLNT